MPGSLTFISVILPATFYIIGNFVTAYDKAMPIIYDFFAVFLQAVYLAFSMGS